MTITTLKHSDKTKEVDSALRRAIALSDELQRTIRELSKMLQSEVETITRAGN